MSEKVDRHPSSSRGGRMAEATQDLPERLAVLVGIPRSGTTIVARVIARHFRIKSLIEPYHSRRTRSYSTTDLKTFIREAGGIAKGKSLFMKETTTRPLNITYSLGLMASAIEYHVKPISIVMLRSPVECYLSQVYAAENLWRTRPDFHYGPRWMTGFAMSSFRELQRFLAHAAHCQRKVVFYGRFLRDPKEETRRLMAAFSYQFQPGQLELSKEPPRPGDPWAWSSTEVSRDNASKRSAEVEKFAADFAELPGGQAMMRLHGIINGWTTGPTIEDELVWDEIERALRTEAARLAASEHASSRVA